MFSEHKVSNEYYHRSESIERRDNSSLCGMLAVVTTAVWSVWIIRPSITVLSKGRPAPPTPFMWTFGMYIFIVEFSQFLFDDFQDFLKANV